METTTVLDNDIQAHSVSYAGFWIRVGATFLDWIILGIIQVLITLAAGESFLAQDVNWPLFSVNMIINIIYYCGMESSAKQATLGKMALNLKVTDTAGNRIGFGRALARYLGKIASALILFIGFIMVAFTDKKQGLHDMIGGTLVVNSRSELI